MKKFVIGVSLLMTSGLAQADLVDGSILNFTPLGSGGSATSLPASGQGSWFALGIAGGGQFVVTPISSLNGLEIGSTQLATSIPAVGNIDTPWNFFANLGVHQTVSDANILSVSGDTATVDLSGWNVSWNGSVVDLGTGAWNGNVDGVANIVCELGSGCGDGASYTLDYSAKTPPEISGKGGLVRYALHLEGTISAVPVPAAVWLFGSGLVGLVGLARRKQQS